MTGWIVAGGIALFIALLLCAPVCADVRYDGGFTVFVSYLFVRFRVVPAKPRGETKKKKEKKKTEKKEKPEEKKTPGEKLEELKKTLDSVLELVNSAKGPLKLLLKSVMLFLLDLRVTLASEDAAKTGESYGRACAAAYPVLAQLRQLKRPWRESVVIRPDFIRQESVVYARVRLGVAPVSVLAAALGFAFNYLGAVIKKSGKKTTAYRTSAPQRRA